ncbi:hypothetical protein IF2G_11098 [Cordyceps javanica]|nr:hypothetical protein IF2G_11098 [Cordyceps javanica]
MWIPRHNPTQSKHPGPTPAPTIQLDGDNHPTGTVTTKRQPWRKRKKLSGSRGRSSSRHVGLMRKGVCASSRHVGLMRKGVCASSRHVGLMRKGVCASRRCACACMPSRTPELSMPRCSENERSITRRHAVSQPYQPLEDYLKRVHVLNYHMARLFPPPSKTARTLSEGQQSKSTTHGRTDIVKKYYPLRICPWTGFPELSAVPVGVRA